MITTLTGSNGFLIRSKVKQQVDGFVAKYTDMGLEQFDGEEAAYDRMREALESLPFLVSKKLVVLRTPSANKQFVENAERLFGGVPETTDVIIVEPKMDKRTSYFKYLQKQTDFHEMTEPDEQQLSQWLVEQAKIASGTMSLADARYLVDRIGANQQLAMSELEKLLLSNPAVTRETITMLVEPTPQSTIFDLMDAAFAGKLPRALQLYTEQRQAKVEPQQIMAMIAWQLYVLAVIKTAGDRDSGTIAREAHLNPYVVRKTTTVVQGLSLVRLKQLVREALELDVRLKSETIDADDAIQHYLMQLAQ